eukprot:5663975-Alexandrium_andersonii.AAC.1
MPQRPRAAGRRSRRRRRCPRSSRRRVARNDAPTDARPGPGRRTQGRAEGKDPHGAAASRGGAAAS